jgi:flagellar operon protein (TIGR03826 family)
MKVINCRKCGRIFNYIVGPQICPKCKEEVEAKFQEVKKFVQENKQANINDISAECDVEIGQINQWIREERLFFSEDSPIGINCESCGTMIKTGRYCEKCKMEMARGLNNSIRKNVPAHEEHANKENPKMRFLDR